MKRQTDLTKKDLSAAAIRQFKSLSARLGSDNVTGGEWYVRLQASENGVPLLLLVIPIQVRQRNGEWEHEEYVTVVA